MCRWLSQGQMKEGGILRGNCLQEEFTTLPQKHIICGDKEIKERENLSKVNMFLKRPAHNGGFVQTIV